MLESNLKCKYCEHCMECFDSEDVENEGCEIFELRNDMWFEMSYYRLVPKTMQQRLREGE